MHHQLCINTTDHIKNNGDDDNHTRTRNKKRDRSTSSTEPTLKEEWCYGDKSEEKSSPKSEVINRSFEKFSRFLPRTVSWDESSTVLDVVSYFLGFEDDGYVEVREGKDQNTVEDVVPEGR